MKYLEKYIFELTDITLLMIPEEITDETIWNTFLGYEESYQITSPARIFLL